MEPKDEGLIAGRATMIYRVLITPKAMDGLDVQLACIQLSIYKNGFHIFIENSWN